MSLAFAWTAIGITDECPWFTTYRILILGPCPTAPDLIHRVVTQAFRRFHHFRRVRMTTRDMSKTTTASMKSCPPSFWDSMPITNKWEPIAPHISSKLNRAPHKAVAGKMMSKPAISSLMPVPILPQGSTPSLVNSTTDSSCPVNLKYSVCSRMMAMANLSIQSIHFYV